ncbi:M28 family peptidase [Hyalangium rubrum]|uniref:M28 family peptidase n=1 Tax=Hyalangium rubrum TaxID=3103134 RepID=A0ABU5GUQ7_9BACT|nr:M28 family peptidase [Hyalangium sp. s54d21]MDY7224910.1 M28 family peptidase [Hyalangium sp. s54d21]
MRALSETFHPRDSLHPENLERAATYLSEHLSRAGGQVDSQTYRVGDTRYRNVIARFGPESAERLVIGAHYDTAGPLPGADDNASGVAGLLELANLLGQHPPPVRVELVGFTLEEPPYFRTEHMGSRVHAKSLRQAGVKVRAMLSLETIGTFTDAPDSQHYPIPQLRWHYPSTGNFIAVVGELNDGGLVRQVATAMRAGGPLPVEFLNAPASLEGIDFSDHASYQAEGYRAAMVTDTAFFRNPRYHEPTDTWDTLDYARMAQVIQGVHCAVRELTRP